MKNYELEYIVSDNQVAWYRHLMESQVLMERILCRHCMRKIVWWSDAQHSYYKFDNHRAGFDV